MSQHLRNPGAQTSGRIARQHAYCRNSTAACGSPSLCRVVMVAPNVTKPKRCSMCNNFWSTRNKHKIFKGQTSQRVWKAAALQDNHKHNAYLCGWSPVWAPLDDRKAVIYLQSHLKRKTPYVNSIKGKSSIYQNIERWQFFIIFLVDFQPSYNTNRFPLFAHKSIGGQLVRCLGPLRGGSPRTKLLPQLSMWCSSFCILMYNDVYWVYLQYLTIGLLAMFYVLKSLTTFI